jgi:alanine dehydrogenase
MRSEGTLLLRRSDVEKYLTLEQCVDAVETIFRWQGEGRLPVSAILGLKAPHGGFHVKAAHLPGDRNYLVAKLNTNFPGNAERFALPTIQGLIVVCNAENGSPLAVVDSIDITIKRTAAATAVAARYLARPDSSVVILCGCGEQGLAQLRALGVVLPLRKVRLFDLNRQTLEDFAETLGQQSQLEIELVADLGPAIQQSDICVTCTPSREFFVRKRDVSPGTFIAAVGADAEDKQEIDPALMATAKIVVDNLDQCLCIGDLHHAVTQGLMRAENVYAELAQVVAGQKPGRTSDDEIIIFDSTGVALEDAIAVVTVYNRASAARKARYFNFAA